MRDNVSLRTRLIVAGLLLFLALLLLAGQSLVQPRGPGRIAAAPLQETIDRKVDSLLTSFGVDRSGEKKWSIRSRNGSVVRVERRVRVSPDLISILLNRDLSRAVRPLGAHVTGTERTRESLVVLHVIAGGTTVHTIALEMSTQQPR